MINKTNLNVARAKEIIDNFSLNQLDYLVMEYKNGNKVYFECHNDLKRSSNNIKFEETAHNATVIIRKGAQTQKATIILSGHDNIIYLGKECQLGQSFIRTQEVGSYIVIGNKVTFSLYALIAAGQGGNKSKQGILIGDDCMSGHNVRIRSTDAHPIYDINTIEHINKPTKGITIEPHVWLCENTTILKDVTIGACSIIGMNTTVTKDINRFSTYSGSIKTNNNKVWTRNTKQKSIDDALAYVNKYKHQPSEKTI